MAINAHSCETINTRQVPSMPVPRHSKALGVVAFAKDHFKFFIIPKLGWWAGLLGGNHLPTANLETLSNKSFSLLKTLRVVTEDKKWNALGLANWTASLAGVMVAYLHWRKVAGRQFGVKNISQDLSTVLDPKTLQAETEQNQRIQDGIKTLTASSRNIQSRGSYTDAALQEAAANGSPTR